MTKSDAGGLLAAFLGALIGYHYPSVIVGFLVVWGLVVLTIRSLEAVSARREMFSKKWKTIDSVLASTYYRTRIRALVLTGRVKKKS